MDVSEGNGAVQGERGSRVFVGVQRRLDLAVSERLVRSQAPEVGDNFGSHQGVVGELDGAGHERCSTHRGVRTDAVAQYLVDPVADVVRGEVVE